MQGIVRVWMALMLSSSMVISGWGNYTPAEHAQGTLILVNKQYEAPGLKPQLVLPDIPASKPAVAGNLFMRPDAATALEQLFAAAKADGQMLYGISGYRSYASQKAIYERRMDEDEKSAKKYVAPPGHSEHHTGLAMDVTGESMRSKGLVSTFAETPEGKWVAEHAHEYGYIVRYQKGWEDITGYAYEPWHIRYVGVEHATAMFRQHITLEEYLQQLTGQRAESLRTMVTPAPTASPPQFATPAPTALALPPPEATPAPSPIQ